MSGDEREWAASRHLAVLWRLAMFVLVVDTSLMNVSIASVADLDTTVSGVQGAFPDDPPARPGGIRDVADGSRLKRL